MCVNYTDLNKAYKKDPFGLPRIDQVMDSTIGCSLLSFVDCYPGYHQIPLKVKDHIKTSFITQFGAFCYTTMSFRLKSAGVHTKGVYKSVSIVNSGAMVKHMLMTWSSKLERTNDSSLTW
jgi:hypothetical protein